MLEAILHEKNTPHLPCAFDIYQFGQPELTEKRRQVNAAGHQGLIYELNSPEGIHFGYYNMQSAAQGSVSIQNLHPYLQLSYAVNGRKAWSVGEEAEPLVSFEQQQYNYIFFTEQAIRLNWPANEKLEIFELALSPEVFTRFLPESHPFYPLFTGHLEKNTTALMSPYNLPITPTFSNILYDMLNCPLEKRYKQLYIKAKTIELLSFQLEQYEHVAGHTRLQEGVKTLRKEDIERMYQARDIIIKNLDSPCSLIDLAHQVGTNENYLKSHFKQLFGTTVFGYMYNLKMNQAKDLLLQGKTVAEVAYITGYKNAPHFTRAFKKHFGYAPNKIRK